MDLKSNALDSMIWPSDQEYIQIINLKRTAYKEKKAIKKGKIALIIILIFSVLSVYGNWLLVIPLAAYSYSLYILKQQPKLALEITMAAYGLVQLYSMGIGIKMLGFSPFLLAGLVIPGIFFLFLWLGYQGAKKYEVAKQRLVDLEVNVAMV